MKKLLMSLAIFLLSVGLCFAAPTYYHVTPAGAGAKDGAAWASAMGYAEWETSAEALTTETDIYYFVAGGTYTLTSDFAVTGDGTALLPNRVIGVKSTTTHEGAAIVASDWATGTDRPLITDGASAYTFTFDDYWQVKNIRVTGSDTECMRLDTGGIVENCYAYNDAAGTPYAFRFGGTGCLLLWSEGISTNGYAVSSIGSSSIIGNYLYDSSVAIIITDADQNKILSNIIDTCATGISAGNGSILNLVFNNTFYSGTTAITTGTGSYGWIVVNNIISTFTTGFEWGDTSSNAGVFDYNDIYNCTTDRTNVPVGSHDIDADPLFTDAANGDFTLQTGSPCLNTGFPGTIPGATGDY